MSSIIESESRILAGILPENSVRMETAQLRLISEANFSNPDFKIMWKFIDAYYDDHMAIIPGWVLKNTLSNASYSDAKIVSIMEIHKVLSAATVLDHEFKSALNILKQEEATRRTDEAIVTAREILKGDYYDSKGENTLKGQEDARAYLSEALQELEVTDGDYAPEGDVKDDMEKILKAYLEKESNPEKAGGIKYGIQELDMCTGGIRPGELVLVAGFTSSGKSQLVSSLAWNAMREGKNVIMFTTETTREEMEIRIIARHSRLPQFKTPGGLDSHDIQNGTLSSNHKAVFVDVLKDFKTNNPGELFMVQMPSSGNVEYVYAKTNQYNRRAPIDLVIVDSINLLRMGRRYDSKREMFDEMLPDFKRFASAFDGGRGVAVVSPWQMSRTAWREATEAGGIYTLASLADTSEAEKCFPHTTFVLTPEGPRPLGNFSPGHKLFDMNGEIQTVTEVHENPNTEIYEVEFNDGTILNTSPGHVWRTINDKGRPDLMTTLEIMNKGEAVTIPYEHRDLQYPRTLVRMDEMLHPRALAEIFKYAETDMEGMWITPRDFKDFLKHLPTPDKVIVIGDEPKFYFTWASIEEHLGEFAFFDISEANLMQSDRNQYEVPFGYWAGPYNVRTEFVCGMFQGYLPTPPKSISMSNYAPKMEFIDQLPLNHPGLGEGMRRAVSSFGWPMVEGPRQIVAVRPTGRVELTLCISVTGPSSTYLVESGVVTHNSASQIITIYKDDEVGGASRLNIQVLKNRGGEEMAKVAYPYDYRNSFIGASGDAQSGSKGKESKSELNMNISDFLS